MDANNLHKAAEKLEAASNDPAALKQAIAELRTVYPADPELTKLLADCEAAKDDAALQKVIGAAKKAK